MEYDAYQLTFNPAKSTWNGQKASWWFCRNTNVAPGNEIYLLRLGTIPDQMKGIVGRGVATSLTYSCKTDWGDTAVDFSLSVVALNDEPPLVPLAALRKLPGNQDWSNQSCGIGIKPAAVKALHRLLGSPSAQPDDDPARRILGLGVTRPAQAAFAAAVRARFQSRCVLSGLNEFFAGAAHIVGYAECKTSHEQIDPHNGLYLAAHLHVAFDSHIFGIRPDGTVVWSTRIGPAERKRLGRLQKSVPVSPRSRPYLERRWKSFQEFEGCD